MTTVAQAKDKKRREAGELVAQVLAVETLEYYDKNWLSGDNKVRSERKQEALRVVLELLDYEEPREGG